MTLVTTLLIVAAAGCVAVIVLLLLPRRKTVSVRVDDGSVVHVERTDDNVTLKVEYQSWRDRPSDDELFPELSNVPAQETDEARCGGAFWQKAARLRELPVEERERIISTLLQYGFIYDPSMCAMAMTETAAEAGDAPADATVPAAPVMKEYDSDVRLEPDPYEGYDGPDPFTLAFTVY